MEGKTCLWDLALVPVRDEGGLARRGRERWHGILEPLKRRRGRGAVREMLSSGFESD